MALTLGELVSGGGLHDPRGLMLGDMGIFHKKKKKKKKKNYQAPHDANMRSINTIQQQIRSAMGKIVGASRAARDQAFLIQDLANRVQSPAAFALQGDAEAMASDIQAMADEASQEAGSFTGEFNQKKSQYGSNPTWAAGTWGINLISKGKASAGSIRQIAGRIARASSTLSSMVSRLKSLQDKVAKESQASAAAASAAAADAERRRQLDYERQIREEDRQREIEDRRYQREDAANAAEAAFQSAQVEEQRRLINEERDREQYERDQIAELRQQERDRASALEQQAFDRAAAREQQTIAAAERRMQLEEAASIRAAESAMRREERESQLAQLMMIQELAASGLPTSMLPPGLLPPQPQQPGLSRQAPGSQYSMPGFARPAPVQQGAWTPYGQVVQGPAGPAPAGFSPHVPGFPVAQQGVPAGYAAQPAPASFQQVAPAPQMQQPFPQQPAPPAGPGFAWSGFDPGTEMFGMGGMGELMPTLNPNLQGALIEENWVIRGPNGNDQYGIFRPNGQVFGSYTEDQLFQGAIRDQNNQTIFVPPATRPEGSGATAASVASSVATVLASAVNAYGSIETEKQRRKAAATAAKIRARGGFPGMYAPQGFPSLSVPGGGYSPNPYQRRTSTAAYVFGGLALAATAFVFVPKLMGGKKGKKEE